MKHANDNGGRIELADNFNPFGTEFIEKKI